MIATAAHEVQRPVFFARIIIIVSYLPIFTLQRVEGRLFRPMAWTVAFALLGALLFALLIAPVLCTLLFKDEIKEWRNPLFDVPAGTLRPHSRVVLRSPEAYSGNRRRGARGHDVPALRRRHRFRISASS